MIAFLSKMVLKRPFVGSTVKDCSECSVNISEDRALGP